MKKLICAALALVFCFAAAGCGEKVEEKAPFQSAETIQSLVEAQVFGYDMMELDYTMLFQFEEGAVDAANSLVYYTVTGGGEIAAVITAASAEKVAHVEQVLNDWVSATTTMETGYRPAEVEKLEHAIMETRGTTVLLTVAADWEAAAAVIAEIS